MQLRVEPAEVRADLPPVLVLEGSPAAGDVSLTVTTADAVGHRLCSSTPCRVAPGGTLELSDSERRWWNMKFSDPAGAPVAFQAPDTALDYQLEVKAPGAAASATVRRLWADGIAREDLEGQG